MSATTPRSSVRLRSLSSAWQNARLQLLHATGATVTETLEECFGEPIQAVKLAELSRPLEEALPELDAPAGTQALTRRVLLCGTREWRPFLYAKSTILPARLPDSVVRALLETSSPIGRILADHGVETAIQGLKTWTEPAGEGDAISGSERTLLGRSYRLVVRGAPAMLIREQFPAAWRWSTTAPIREPA
jgi:chorismate-pyruvate lyase